MKGHGYLLRVTCFPPRHGVRICA